MSSDVQTPGFSSISVATGNTASHSVGPSSALFVPISPKNLRESGLKDFEVESLVVKALHTMGAASSRVLAEQIKLPGQIVRETLDHLRAELLVVHRGTSDLVDFVFQLTEGGVQRAQQYEQKNTYCGSAPVTLPQYVDSVNAQSVASKTISLDDFRKAMRGISLSHEIQSQLAQAVNAGRGLFLYGPPGNGKTIVATQLMDCYSDPIWIPRAVTIGGDIIRLYDPSVHVAVDVAAAGYDRDCVDLDTRWILIKRPTVVVGGELTMEHLEIKKQYGTNVLEAPVQMKSNGGMLVIDDFGRQRISPTDILNRWIVPLERREDFLTLPNGRQIQVPFGQTLVLATNLEPTELVDEAFLRRIPYKIELTNPSISVFRNVFTELAASMRIGIEQGGFEYLIENHYKPTNRPVRFCHARDLLWQISNLCDLHGLPRMVTPRTLDAVVRNYFGAEQRFQTPPNAG